MKIVKFLNFIFGEVDLYNIVHIIFIMELIKKFRNLLEWELRWEAVRERLL